MCVKSSFCLLVCDNLSCGCGMGVGAVCQQCVDSRQYPSLQNKEKGGPPLLHNEQRVAGASLTGLVEQRWNDSLLILQHISTFTEHLQATRGLADGGAGRGCLSLINYH